MVTRPKNFLQSIDVNKHFWRKNEFYSACPLMDASGLLGWMRTTSSKHAIRFAPINNINMQNNGLVRKTNNFQAVYVGVMLLLPMEDFTIISDEYLPARCIYYNIVWLLV